MKSAINEGQRYVASPTMNSKLFLDSLIGTCESPLVDKESDFDVDVDLDAIEDCHFLNFPSATNTLIMNQWLGSALNAESSSCPHSLFELLSHPKHTVRATARGQGLGTSFALIPEQESGVSGFVQSRLTRATQIHAPSIPRVWVDANVNQRFADVCLDRMKRSTISQTRGT
jgi:hypothetical protein